MRLAELLKDIKFKNIYGSLDLNVEDISIKSNSATTGSIFTAIVGFKKDGHNFVHEAVERGAVAVMTQKKVKLPPAITQIIVDDCRKSLPILCRNFFGNPSKFFKLIGITGTNGKTTTCFLISSILKNAGVRTSLITTVESSIMDEITTFDRTTPECLDLNRFFLKSKDKNIDAACMEISSHSIDLHRIDYLMFDHLVFTNLSQDHLDYHKNINNYFNVKKRIFLKKYRDIYGGKSAVINIDDSYGLKIAKATDLKTVTYSLNGTADIRAGNIENSIYGIKMDVHINGSQKQFKITSSLCGYFNVYNILAAIGACLEMGVEVKHIQSGIKSMNGVKGRFEKVALNKNSIAIIDYAHTPDGLENVLKTLKQILEPGVRIIVVFGCGGDRDKKKRGIMGCISGRYADFNIITSDNPRNERPEAIINMIEKGLAKAGNKNYIKEIDRKKAIITALNMVGSNDIVLIAGKGHENYQEFKDFRISFSDQEVVKDWICKKR